MKRLILDADGVFLDERPYWNAALGTAFVLGGVASCVNGRWDRLADVAFGQARLQLVTKKRGCNSNWDLAAVLAKAVGCGDVRETLIECVTGERYEDAAGVVLDGADRLWREAAMDPLRGFGIDRQGEEFAEVVGVYQRVLGDEAGLDWAFERSCLRESRETTCAALEACEGLRYELWVCTGRCHKEVVEPIRLLGLAGHLSAERVVSGDTVEAGEGETGLGSLGKPHWFAPACAAIGYDAAVACVRGVSVPDVEGVVAYVGDGESDFRAVVACNEIGLRMAYVHVRSEASTSDVEAAAVRSPHTLGLMDGLGELPGLLRRLGG